MVEFDKGRAIRIVDEVIETYGEMLQDHTSDESYTSPEEMLQRHAEYEGDRDTMVGLKTHLESDCE
jgi:hypothetical protein